MADRKPDASQGLANQTNHGRDPQAQQDPNQKKQPDRQGGAGAGQPRGGTMNSPGDANESGSAGSTRRDDTSSPGNQR
jgi:hypothetical protein